MRHETRGRNFDMLRRQFSLVNVVVETTNRKKKKEEKRTTENENSRERENRSASEDERADSKMISERKRARVREGMEERPRICYYQPCDNNNNAAAAA